MPTPGEVDAWMRWEFDKLNAGVVAHPKSVEALLDGATLATKEGDEYHIDEGVLSRIAAVCAPEERDRLRLPVTLHFTADVPDSAFAIDALAAEVLHRIEGWGAAYPYRDGRMWLPQSLAVDLLIRYGGALQRVML